MPQAVGTHGFEANLHPQMSGVDLFSPACPTHAAPNVPSEGTSGAPLQDRMWLHSLTVNGEPAAESQGKGRNAVRAKVAGWQEEGECRGADLTFCFENS